MLSKECSSLPYSQNFNGEQTETSRLHQSLKGKAGAGEPTTPLADEFEHILAHWAVRGL